MIFIAAYPDIVGFLIIFLLLKPTIRKKPQIPLQPRFSLCKHTEMTISNFLVTANLLPSSPIDGKTQQIYRILLDLSLIRVAPRPGSVLVASYPPL